MKDKILARFTQETMTRTFWVARGQRLRDLYPKNGHTTCATSRVVNRFKRGWWNAQHHYSTCLCSNVTKQVARFLFPVFPYLWFFPGLLAVFCELQMFYDLKLQVSNIIRNFGFLYVLSALGKKALAQRRRKLVVRLFCYHYHYHHHHSYVPVISSNHSVLCE